MRIVQLTLPVSDVAHVAAYFRDTFQLPVTKDTVQIGWTRLQLRAAGTDPVGGVHLALWRSCMRERRPRWDCSRSARPRRTSPPWVMTRGC